MGKYLNPVGVSGKVDCVRRVASEDKTFKISASSPARGALGVLGRFKVSFREAVLYLFVASMFVFVIWSIVYPIRQEMRRERMYRNMNFHAC